MALYLLVTALIILVCIASNKIASKLGVPMLLAFILLGMLFGSDGFIKIPFNNYQFAEQICSTALIIIMFYGGFGTKWSEAKPIAVKAILLSTVGVIMTAAITGAFCHIVLRIDLMESLLIGSVISSTDAASVFSILRSKRLNLKYNTASMLEVESGSNDPCSYMLTVIMLAIMNESVNKGTLIYMVFSQIVYGIVIAIILSFFAYYIIRRSKVSTPGFDAIFVLAVALIAYALPTVIGGNGYLCAYIVGIILGNSPIKNKSTLVHFFDGLTGLMQMLIFFLLGLLAFPSQLPNVIVPAICIAIFLTFVARPVTVFALLTPFGCKFNQQALVSWAGLRGAASIVFAIIATIDKASTNNDIFHIVFCIVLFSILLQGTLIPYLSKKLKLIDDKADVFRTFTDYTNEMPVQLIRLTMSKAHPWIGKTVKDILFPPDTLLVLIHRNGDKIVPNGNTELMENDVLVLTAGVVDNADDIHITEIIIGKEDEWIGKSISDVYNNHDKLVIMIQRNNGIIIPNGKTMLKENDVLVISQTFI